jgi:hypothetical protein
MPVAAPGLKMLIETTVSVIAFTRNAMPISS